MAKQQKAKVKDVQVKKSKKSTKGPKESQMLVMLSKKVKAALNQYTYNRDKSGQYLKDGVFMSSEEVQKATKPRREASKEQKEVHTHGKGKRPQRKHHTKA